MIVHIVETECANIASVEAAFQRLGCSTSRTGDAATVRNAPYLVLPGVGHYAPTLSRLRSLQLDSAIEERRATGGEIDDPLLNQNAPMHRPDRLDLFIRHEPFTTRSRSTEPPCLPNKELLQSGVA